MSATETVRSGRARARKEQPDVLPPRPVATFAGTALGVVAGLVFGLWEADVVGRTGLPLPHGQLLSETISLYAVTGGLIGLVVGAARRIGGAWALAWCIVFGGWLISGKLGLAVADSGGAAWAGPAVLVPAAYAVAVIASATEMSEPQRSGVAGFLFVLLALGLPTNLHLLGSAFSRLALVVDLGIVVLAAIAGAVAFFAAASSDRAGVLLPLGLAAALGGLALVPVRFRKAPSWPQATSDARPPIVLVIIDTLRADHLGVYGYDRHTSPHLDARAAHGVVFEDASAAAPWTLPSVASILTGLTAARHGAGVNLGNGTAMSPLRPSVATLAERLASAGYATAGITTNPFLTATFGFQRGFQRYDGAPRPAAMPAAVHPLEALGIDLWPPYRDATTITDQALSFVAAQKHSQWFLLVHYMDVHGPWNPPAQDVAAVGTSGEGDVMDAYDASIHEVDRELARLLAAVPSNAWVVVTADHGEQLLEKRDIGRGVPPGTRHGHTLYQEQLHVPLIVWGPRLGGRRVSRPVSLVDVAPTLLKVAGQSPPDRASGFALPEVTGTGTPRNEEVYADSVRWGPEQQMIREGRYKLIRWYRQGTLLYDLQDQPGEITPVRVRGDQKMQGLVHHLEGELPPVGIASVEPAPPMGAEVQELLERLGYTDSAPKR